MANFPIANASATVVHKTSEVEGLMKIYLSVKWWKEITKCETLKLLKKFPLLNAEDCRGKFPIRGWTEESHLVSFGKRGMINGPVKLHCQVHPRSF
mmetsp:Transcript_28552/g.62164  ORF Transcript_28552/g.62164 Transcript_28552/m.62164 type:complete len:96 (-) Transcript_28552:1999-2286(-)